MLNLVSNKDTTLKIQGNRFCRYLCAAVLFIVTSLTTHSENLAILYPEIREPYRQVFLSITEGIEQQYRGHSISLALTKNHKPNDTISWLDKNNIDAIITLGKRGLRTLDYLPKSIPTVVVVGAVNINPNDRKLTGISLIPAPDRLFETLHLLTPNLETIHLIHKPGPSDWIIDTAKETLEDKPIKLNAIPAHSIQEIAKIYKSTLEKMKPQKDALWISFNGKRLDRAILQATLRTAWNKELVVFSSSLADVKRGALFSLYPNNDAMGKKLADLVHHIENNPNTKHQIHPVINLFTAVNIRTASHLKLNISKEDQTNFDLTYPAK